MKKITLIVTVFLVLLIVISALFFFITKQSENKQTPQPAKNLKQSTLPQAITPQDLDAEKNKQESYAKSRQDFLTAKPWVLKLPLKADNYFVSYNPNSDALIVELYYTGSQDKNQQLLKAKHDALNAISSVGVDINKQKIEYTELLK